MLYGRQVIVRVGSEGMIEEACFLSLRSCHRIVSIYQDSPELSRKALANFERRGTALVVFIDPWQGNEKQLRRTLSSKSSVIKSK